MRPLCEAVSYLHTLGEKTGKRASQQESKTSDETDNLEQPEHPVACSKRPAFFFFNDEPTKAS